MKNSAIILTLLYVVLSCGGRKASSTTPATDVVTPEFCADSAYNYIKAQTDFGPRVPNTDAQQNCAAWLMTKLKEFGAETFLQGFETVTFDKTRIRGYNIIGSYNPESPTRIILCSHWDSRPWADNDPDPANWMKPVDAANDGASGVAVLLQLARQLKESGTTLGIDIVLVDAEDMGENDNEDSWGLGAQYWAEHPHVAGYKPLFGILLDMVGSEDATFTREYYSMQYANGFVDLVWKCAAGSHFINAQGGAVTDDHIFINRAGIPCIDIIDMRSDSETGFCPEWHTVDDTIGNISPATLAEVGQTLLNVIAQLEQ